MSTHKDRCPGSNRTDGRLTLSGKVKCPVCGELLEPMERKEPAKT